MQVKRRPMQGLHIEMEDFRVQAIAPARGAVGAERSLNQLGRQGGDREGQTKIDRSADSGQHVGPNCHDVFGRGSRR